MENQLETYVALFKQFIMENLQGDQSAQLRHYMFQLIEDDSKQCDIINKAFHIVRKEVIGA